ncbi:lytic transglycosylase domain-containing protein [Rubellimicrobium aerolatum]|uniref:Lytic transglycosylase domain-containing protein n=1 Tax=Rubellimicrobium aerolatum TaxID=490979 RepID=A0ABW0S9U9_9RHOB|nr:lytic transglycosylase domain-containing protein [Rubellimicrobium aerolatum]MBP1805078.1 hypothetical protein [Rubellimicrobium aerolatum]
MSGVPLSVLIAVTLTETGRGRDGTRRPWPWTVNMEGEGHWFATRDEALAFAQARHASGAESFDVGCFQINWLWHHENFVSIDQMFDPLANATYAASFLRTLAEEKGGWSEAAGAFHSRTPDLAAKYRALFDENLAVAQAAGVDGGELAGPFAAQGTLLAEGKGLGAPRVNTFPLLKPAGGALRLGSLVPLGDG